MENKEWYLQEASRSMVQFGLEMLRYTFLVNGAAILAILTFLGDIKAKGQVAPDLHWSIISFVVGIIFSGLAIFSAYISQFHLFRGISKNKKEIEFHIFWLYVTLAIVLFGILAFSVGALLAASSLK